MATQKELRDQIVIDNDVLGHPKFNKPRLNRMINLAQRKVQTKLNGLGFKKWEKTNAVSTGMVQTSWASAVANCMKIEINETNLPKLLESPKAIRFIELNDGESPVNHGIAYEVEPEEFEEHIKNAYLVPLKTKPIFSRISGNVYIAPKGFTSATIHYYKRVTDLIEDTSETEIPGEFEGFIVQLVGAEIQAILGKLQEKEVKLQEVNSEIDKAWEKFIGKYNADKIDKSEKLQ